MNRILANMPYHRLTQMITHTAQWEGISVIKVDERDTSKTCHRCGKTGKRPFQGLFKCSNCGLECNADLNGAINIDKRFEGYMPSDGATSEMAQTLGR